MSKDEAQTTAVRRSVFLKVSGKELSISRIEIRICKNFLDFFQTFTIFIGGWVVTFSDQKELVRATRTKWEKGEPPLF